MIFINIFFNGLWKLKFEYFILISYVAYKLNRHNLWRISIACKNSYLISCKYWCFFLHEIYVKWKGPIWPIQTLLNWYSSHICSAAKHGYAAIALSKNGSIFLKIRHSECVRYILILDMWRVQGKLCKLYFLWFGTGWERIFRHHSTLWTTVVGTLYQV